MLTKNVLVIQGAAGSGKTSAAQVLAAHWYKAHEVCTMQYAAGFSSFYRFRDAKCVIIEEVMAEHLQGVYELAGKNPDKRFIVTYETNLG